MLKEIKTACFITVDDFDSEFARLISAAAADLRIVGVEIDGLVKFDTDAQTGAVIDKCTVKDPNIIQYIATFVRVHFGSPDDYDRLKASLDAQRATLMSSTGYGFGWEG